ncbi:DUF1810 domain-containing protein [Nocardioides KLBMP 9356]|uniref:DUF1810 domain-containing protein n=1 Tax=Nocardioides potassii TaxID=2911371 RepID=A0ABS9HDN7_9ACTN|nr:DUF1810 domain-containing protein [Nocardioides potassii]MCF6378609.1 DUF1810 domain-containing protein [Nocardioides potassii]
MDLERFVDAQAGTYDQALGELRRGRKSSHWMWWVFPQVAGLGMSSTSQQYAVRDLAEATAYLRHDVLGPRLLECCRALLDLEDVTAEQVLGSIDAVKLRSSMTLFAHADPSEPVFREVLERFYGGEEDGRTVALLE